MGHELVIHGAIEGATWRSEGYRALQIKNELVIAALPENDDWPALVRGMFSLPVAWPVGTYREQVIHFGASFKEDYDFEEARGLWIEKFEKLLSKMWWYGATLVLISETDSRLYSWTPASNWSDQLCLDEPNPVSSWDRSNDPLW